MAESLEGSISDTLATALVRAQKMAFARKHIRGMHSLSESGSFGGYQSSGSRGAENTQKLYDSIQNARQKE